MLSLWANWLQLNSQLNSPGVSFWLYRIYLPIWISIVDTETVYLWNVYLTFDPSEDMLVFLTGQEEIESVARSVREVSLDLPSGELTLTTLSLVNYLQFLCIISLAENQKAVSAVQQCSIENY